MIIGAMGVAAAVAGALIGTAASHVDLRRSDDETHVPNLRIYCSLAGQTGAAEVLDRLGQAGIAPGEREIGVSFALEIANAAPDVVARPARVVSRAARAVTPQHPPSLEVQRAAQEVDRYTATACP